MLFVVGPLRWATVTDLELALELADLADEVSMSRYGSSDLQVTTKPDMTPVSDADRSVEQRLRERLAVARPDDALLGEEFGGQMANLAARFPHINVWGGCCGTDSRHIAQIAKQVGQVRGRQPPDRI